MNSTTGPAADLERARCTARDAIFNWARDPATGMFGLPFGRIKQGCPPEPRKAHDDALTGLAALGIHNR